MPRVSAQEGECTSNEHCDDDCVCTADICVLPEEQCEYVVICEMCSEDSNCDDANPCTFDFCVYWDCGECDGCARCEFEWNLECGEPELPEYAPEPTEMPEPDMETPEESDSNEDGDAPDPGEGTLQGGGCGCMVVG